MEQEKVSDVTNIERGTSPENLKKILKGMGIKVKSLDYTVGETQATVVHFVDESSAADGAQSKVRGHINIVVIGHVDSGKSS